MRHLIHILTIRGSDLSFCWLPSHCGLFFNEKVDFAAKEGAKKSEHSEILNLKLSLHEGYNLLDKYSWSQFQKTCKLAGLVSVVKKNTLKCFNDNAFGRKYGRNVSSLVYRLKLNSFKTKFVKNVKCVCGKDITSKHIILECNILRHILPCFSEKSMTEILENTTLLYSLAIILQNSPIGSLL